MTFHFKGRYGRIDCRKLRARKDMNLGAPEGGKIRKWGWIYGDGRRDEREGIEDGGMTG